MEDDFGVAPPLAPGPATCAEYCDWPFDICDWSLDISKRATGCNDGGAGIDWARKLLAKGLCLYYRLQRV